MDHPSIHIYWFTKRHVIQALARELEETLGRPLKPWTHFILEVVNGTEFRFEADEVSKLVE